jgi:hypothetical protein
VFFGDHQPADSVVSPLYRLNGNNVNNLSVAAMCDRYKVPFFIWANYDIEEERDVVISPGFLGVKTLDVAGVKLSQYQAFLQDLNEELYSVNIFQTTTADNGCRELKVEDKSLLEYRYLQYYHLFGK